MFNPLPILALGAVAIGFAGAINRTDTKFAENFPSAVSAFPATTDLTVQDFVARLPETVQDPYCDKADVITTELDNDFAEAKQDSWSTPENVMMELWASDLMGTWTLLHVESPDMACIIASGFGWAEGMTAQDVLPLAAASS